MRKLFFLLFFFLLFFLLLFSFAFALDCADLNFVDSTCYGVPQTGAGQALGGNCAKYCAKDSRNTGPMVVCGSNFTAASCTQRESCSAGTCSPDKPEIFAQRNARSYTTIYFDTAKYDNGQWDENTDYPVDFKSDKVLFLNGLDDGQRDANGNVVNVLEDRFGCEIAIKDKCLFSLYATVKLVDEYNYVLEETNTLDCLPHPNFPSGSTCTASSDTPKTCRAFFSKANVITKLSAQKGETAGKKARCEITIGRKELKSDYVKLVFDNIKDTSQYDSRQVFLASNDDWRFALSALPVALWETGYGEYCPAGSPVVTLNPYRVSTKCGFPLFYYDPNEELFKYRNESSDSGESVGSISGVVDDYAPSRVISLGGGESASFAQSVLANSSAASKVFAPDISLYSYWKTRGVFVVVNPDDYKAGLVAAQLASILNAPLVFPGNDNREEWEGQIAPKSGESSASYIPKMLIVVGSLNNSAITSNNLMVSYTATGAKPLKYSSSASSTFTLSTLQDFVDRLLNVKGTSGRNVVAVNPRDIELEYCDDESKESYCKMSLLASLYAAGLDFRIDFVSSDSAVGMKEIEYFWGEGTEAIIAKIENIAISQVYPAVGQIFSKWSPTFIVFLAAPKAIPIATAEETATISSDKLDPNPLFEFLNKPLHAYYVDRDLDAEADIAFDYLYSEFVSGSSAKINKLLFTGTYSCPSVSGGKVNVTSLSAKVAYLAELIIDYRRKSFLGITPAPIEAFDQISTVKYTPADAEAYFAKNQPTSVSGVDPGEISCSLDRAYATIFYPPAMSEHAVPNPGHYQVTSFSVGEQRAAVAEFYNTITRFKVALLDAMESVRSIDNLLGTRSIDSVSIDPKVHSLLPDLQERLSTLQQGFVPADSVTLQTLGKETKLVYDNIQKLKLKKIYDEYFYWNAVLEEVFYFVKTYPALNDSNYGMEVWFDVQPAGWITIERDNTWLKANVNAGGLNGLFALDDKDRIKMWIDDRWVDCPHCDPRLKQAIKNPNSYRVSLRDWDDAHTSFSTVATLTVNKEGSWLAAKPPSVSSGLLSLYFQSRFPLSACGTEIVACKAPGTTTVPNVTKYALTKEGSLVYYSSQGEDRGGGNVIWAPGWIPLTVLPVSNRDRGKLNNAYHDSAAETDSKIALEIAMFPWIDGRAFNQAYNPPAFRDMEAALRAQFTENQSALLDYLSITDADSAQVAIKCMSGFTADNSQIDSRDAFKLCANKVRDALSSSAPVSLLDEGPIGVPDHFKKVEYNFLLQSSDLARTFYGYRTEVNEAVANFAVSAVLTVVSFGAGAAASNFIFALQSLNSAGTLASVKGMLGMVSIAADLGYAGYSTVEAHKICSDITKTWDKPIGLKTSFAAANVGPTVTRNFKACQSAMLMASLSYVPLLSAFGTGWTKSLPKTAPADIDSVLLRNRVVSLSEGLDGSSVALRGTMAATPTGTSAMLRTVVKRLTNTNNPVSEYVSSRVARGLGIDVPLVQLRRFDPEEVAQIDISEIGHGWIDDLESGDPVSIQPFWNDFKAAGRMSDNAINKLLFSKKMQDHRAIWFLLGDIDKWKGNLDNWGIKASGAPASIDFGLAFRPNNMANYTILQANGIGGVFHWLRIPDPAGANAGLKALAKASVPSKKLYLKLKQMNDSKVDELLSPLSEADSHVSAPAQRIAEFKLRRDWLIQAYESAPPQKSILKTVFGGGS